MNIYTNSTNGGLENDDSALLGMAGGAVVTSTHAAPTGYFYAFQALTACTINAITTGVRSTGAGTKAYYTSTADADLAAVVIPAGAFVRLRFTALTLTAGTGIAYSTSGP